MVRTEDVKNLLAGACYGKHLSVEPTRKQVRRGYVTLKYLKYAVIDEDIIIMSPKHCERNRFPEVGNYVRAELIDSDQFWGGGFSLRAVSVRVISHSGSSHEQDNEDRDR